MNGKDIKPASTLPISERRRFIRHPLCFPLTYRVIERPPAKGAGKDEKFVGKETKSTTINISMGGLLFAARRPVKIGSVILVKMPFQDKIFNLKAKVVHCDINPETKLYNIGCAFHRLSAAYKVKLVEQLYLISEFRDLKSIELGREISLEKASREWIKRYSDRFRKLYW
ncbi:MAG: PilZ domain-containing protein [Candidatus Omnitrophica bacterium]|nr:PilZ domain-containing protein [Candidatus Omnitrophota bacterium]